jgi:hypothetical protein
VELKWWLFFEGEKNRVVACKLDSKGPLRAAGRHRERAGRSGFVGLVVVYGRGFRVQDERGRGLFPTRLSLSPTGLMQRSPTRALPLV